MSPEQKPNKSTTMPRASIARFELEALFRDATRLRVRVSVSAPWKCSRHWLAQPRIHGLGVSLIPVGGQDSMQALTLALKFLVLRLESLERQRRFRLVWPGTKKRYALRQFLVDPGEPRPGKKA